LRCACYPNNTCNDPLSCVSSVCVDLHSTGGAGGGAAGTTGTAGTIGAAGTTGSAGTIGSAGTTGSAGTIGTAGTTGTAGTIGHGGTTGTGGQASNALVFTTGNLLATDNTFGIQGASFTFDDGVGSTISPTCSADGTAPCFSTVNGTGPLCTSGIGAAVPTTLDYGTYFGSVLGLNLNQVVEIGAVAMPYPASSHGVTGFSLMLTNNESGTVVRLTAVRPSDPDNIYCVNLSSGKNYVHYSNFTLSCWLGAGQPAMSAAQFDAVTSLQWQVPTVLTYTTPFDFCVDSITPLTQ
jgi:hypothetical protein